MQSGMLWFDDSAQHSLEAKVRRAASYYESRHGHKPTVCYVHPFVVMQRPLTVDDIDVEPSSTVLPNHFWLGVDAKENYRTAA